MKETLDQYVSGQRPGVGHCLVHDILYQTFTSHWVAYLVWEIVSVDALYDT